EFDFSYPSALTFGSAETLLMVWASFSMTYSQPLLMALIGAIGDRLKPASPAAGDGVPAFGRGAYVLAGLFAFDSSVAKASSLPVTLAALGLASLVALIRTRRIPRAVVAVGIIVAACQVFSTAVIFRFPAYGLQVRPLDNVSPYWAAPSRSEV